MKSLKSYLCEGFKFGKNQMVKYSCHPETSEELRKIIEKRLEKDKDADLNDIDVSNIYDFQYFNKNTSLYGLFYGLDPHDIKIDRWDMTNAEDISYMFYDCKNFEGKGLENWDVSNVECIHFAFWGCKNFEGKKLNNWNIKKLRMESPIFSQAFRDCINRPSWCK